ncbi:MAG: acyl carrier protein [Propionibacteriaceae bacterium]|jgi:acyl carrier protein|nr:acyl carrier protein [Propionibacteriaceae bacterium]
MTSLSDTDRDLIADIVTDILELDEGELSETSLFREDHGADSMRAIEIVATLERRFGIAIAQSEMAKMTNLAGVYGVVTDARNQT